METRNCNATNVFQLLEDREKAVENGQVLRKADLLAPTIPQASAGTILRYQSSLNAMITRCLALLERRRMQRANSREEFEELDYLNEAIAPEPEKKSPPKPAAPTNEGGVHKRTQKAPAEPKVSSAPEAASASETPVASTATPQDPPRSA